MKKEFMEKFLYDDYVGCFGTFDLSDTICRKHCALKLRCAIEREQNDRLELLEDLVAADAPLLKIQ